MQHKRRFHWFLSFVAALVAVNLAHSSAAATPVGPPAAPENETYPQLDVAVVVFDPNVNEYAHDLDEKGIWPRVRDAESIRFAHQIKKTLVALETFDRVFIAPTTIVSADFYLTGIIEKSTPEILRVRWTLVDARNKVWVKNKLSKYTLHKDWRTRYNQPGADPFQPVWIEIAQTIHGKISQLEIDHRNLMRKEAARKNPRAKPKLSELQTIAHTKDLVFANHLAPTIYGPNIEERRKVYRINHLPDFTSDHWTRVHAFSERDRELMSLYDSQFVNYSNQIEPTYESWQNELYLFSNEARVAKRRTWIRHLIAWPLLIAGIAKMNSVDESDTTFSEEEIEGIKDSGRDLTIAGGIMLIAAAVSGDHSDRNLGIFNERSLDFGLQMEPVTLKVQDNIVTLQGRTSTQMVQWRQTLLQMYQNEEATANDIVIQ